MMDRALGYLYLASVAIMMFSGIVTEQQWLTTSGAAGAIGFGVGWLVKKST